MQISDQKYFKARRGRAKRGRVQMRSQLSGFVCQHDHTLSGVHIRPSNFVQVLSFSWQESSSKHFFWLNQCSKDLFWRNVLNVQLFWKKKGNSFWWFPNFVKYKKKKHGNLIIFTFQTLLFLLKAKLTINKAEKNFKRSATIA